MTGLPQLQLSAARNGYWRRKAPHILRPLHNGFNFSFFFKKKTRIMMHTQTSPTSNLSPSSTISSHFEGNPIPYHTVLYQYWCFLGLSNHRSRYNVFQSKDLFSTLKAADKKLQSLCCIYTNTPHLPSPHAATYGTVLHNNSDAANSGAPICKTMARGNA